MVGLAVLLVHATGWGLALGAAAVVAVLLALPPGFTTRVAFAHSASIRPRMSRIRLACVSAAGSGMRSRRISSSCASRSMWAVRSI